MPAPGVSVADLEQAIDREVARIREGAIDDADVQRAQTEDARSCYPYARRHHAGGAAGGGGAVDRSDA